MRNELISVGSISPRRQVRWRALTEPAEEHIAPTSRWNRWWLSWKKTRLPGEWARAMQRSQRNAGNVEINTPFVPAQRSGVKGSSNACEGRISCAMAGGGELVVALDSAAMRRVGPLT